MSARPEHLTKYPRTPHLPWSPGRSSDDVWFDSSAHFEGREVVITEKMDGENTTMYRDYIHARSLDSRHHASRSWVKGLHQQIAHHIPERWRVCGENLYARHAIGYEDLPSYFMVFSIWDAHDRALGWDETLEWCELLGVSAVPQVWRGVWDEQVARELPQRLDLERQEGFVVRSVAGFAREDFATHLAKWVRPGHVNEEETHWMYAQIVPNGLAASDEEAGR